MSGQLYSRGSRRCSQGTGLVVVSAGRIQHNQISLGGNQALLCDLGQEVQP